MSLVQLDLFESNNELELLRKEIFMMRESLDRQRKSQFAKINELSRMLIQQQDEIDKMKFYIRGEKK